MAPKIIECVVSPKGVSIVMEKVDGVSLADLITDDPSGKKLLALVPKIADTFRQLHALGIVHRDAHIENVFVTRKGDVKIIDFGRAGRMIQSDGRVDLSNVKLDYHNLTNFHTWPDFQSLRKLRDAFVKRLDPYVRKDLAAYKKGDYVFTGPMRPMKKSSKKSVRKPRKVKK